MTHWPEKYLYGQEVTRESAIIPYQEAIILIFKDFHVKCD